MLVRHVDGFVKLALARRHAPLNDLHFASYTLSHELLELFLGHADLWYKLDLSPGEKQLWKLTWARLGGHAIRCHFVTGEHNEQGEAHDEGESKEIALRLVVPWWEVGFHFSVGGCRFARADECVVDWGSCCCKYRKIWF